MDGRGHRRRRRACGKQLVLCARRDRLLGRAPAGVDCPVEAAEVAKRDVLHLEFQTGHYIYEWANRPHEPVTLMRVRARITDPAPGTTFPAGQYTVRGKAWSGTGPVTQVDVSLTGEGDWHPAELEPPKGPYQWQDWSFQWEATTPGRHSLRARATDAGGNVQPDVPPWNRLGYGNNAIEVSYVDVR